MILSVLSTANACSGPMTAHTVGRQGKRTIHGTATAVGAAGCRILPCLMYSHLRASGLLQQPPLSIEPSPSTSATLAFLGHCDLSYR